MKLHVSRDLDELSSVVAGWIVNYVKEVLSNHNRFTIALSGGNTPRRLFHLLGSDNFKNKINWKQVHVFWGDERFVSYDDKRNNAKMAIDELLSKVPIPKEQIHRINTEIDPESSAYSYDQLLHQYFDKQLYTFDLVLLGLGDNSHTLSLFPRHDDIIFEKEIWVKAVMLPELDMYRITLTAPVVNRAGRVAFLVSGADKAAALQQVISGKFDPTNHPAQIIRPLNSELYWFVDQPSSSSLTYTL